MIVYLAIKERGKNMEKTTLNALIEAKGKLLEYERKKTSSLAMVYKDKEPIEYIVNAYATMSTNEFISDMMQELIRQRLNNNMQLEVVSISEPILEHVNIDLREIGDTFVLVNHIINNSSSEDVLLSFEQYLILAYYCHYSDIYFIGNKSYIVDENLLNDMINELGIKSTVNREHIVDNEKLSYKITRKLCIGRRDFDQLLENVSQQSSDRVVSTDIQGTTGRVKR